jgi:anaerobic ribonucleoside-triphosphate reductase activating protein
MAMHIAGYEINYEHGALEIFISGCTRNCPGCHNPELQQYGVGKKWQRWMREQTYHIGYEYSMLVDKIWIMGGDLLCQPPEDVIEFLKALRKAAPAMQIIVWSGASSLKEADSDIWPYVDGYKFGGYDETLADETYQAGYVLPKTGEVVDVHLASRNQFFIFKYGNAEEITDGEN